MFKNLIEKLAELKPFILTDIGFENILDWLNACFNIKSFYITMIGFISFGTVSLFIQDNVWNDPEQVYFLLTLVGIDLATGIWKGIKFRNNPDKKFKSRRMNRTIGKLVTYAILLYVSFNLDKNLHYMFFWMPYSFIGSFYATEAWSIIENLSELGYLNKDIVELVKNKLNLKNIFSNSGEKKNK